MKKCLGIAVLILVAPLLAAQQNPVSDHNRVAYKYMKLMLLSSAERMPAEHYGFKPVDAVRTYAEILAHVAETQYVFCSAAMGEKKRASKTEGMATKEGLIAELKAATTYCDAAYDGMTDAKGLEVVTMMQRDTAKLNVLNTNLLHTVEHYGNLITYLRIKGLVPPSSDPEVMKQMMGD